MPHFHDMNGLREYCTEEELLTIANRLREAGGAEVLEAFMPSTPSSPYTCLIANALNFGCRVAGYPAHYDRDRCAYVVPEAPEGFGTWAMELPSAELAQRVADTMDWHYDPMRSVYHVRLPEKVGNTAQAFDRGEGWTAKYVKQIFDY